MVVDILKRSLVAVIGLPVIICLFVFGNKYIIDVVAACLAVMAIYEYMKCMKAKFKPVSWIGYVCAASLAFIHVVPHDVLINYLPLGVVGLIAIMFMHVVFTDMKINFADIATSFFGIVYIVGMFAYLCMLYGFESDGKHLGKIFIAYLFLATWGSDIFAYLVGVKFGKHKFSKISPKKSIEGCLAGVVAAVGLSLIATVLFNNFAGMNFNYLVVAGISLVIGLLGQIGDFSASCIKRYCEVKDFSNLLPGHGGIIDRCDSVIFSAPFAFYMLTNFM